MPPAGRDLQDRVTRLIYEEVKGKGVADMALYHGILSDFMDLGADVVLLGCTELSFANNHDPHKPYPPSWMRKACWPETIRRRTRRRTRESR